MEITVPRMATLAAMKHQQLSQ